MRRLVIFFSLTFVISWTLFIVAAIASRSADARNGVFSPLGYFIYLLGVFTPALMAILFCWHENKRTGVIALLGKIIKAPSNLLWYVFAIGYFLSIKLIAAIIYRVGVGQWPSFSHDAIVTIVAAIIFSTPFQAGEEIGWRGFALPRLANQFRLPIASIVLGIIWAVWHLPFFFLAVGDKSGQSFPLYFFNVIPISVAMAWLYWRTEASLLLTMLMHAAINNTTDIVPSASPGATNIFSFHASLIGWVSTTLLWTVAIYFLIRMRGAKIPT